MITNRLQQNVPRLRFLGFEGEWKAKKLDSLLKYTVDNRGKTPPIKNSGIPLIEVNAIGEKEVQYSVVSKYVNQETYDKWFRNYLENGDVLFSTVGRTALLSRYTDSKKAVIAQNIVGLRASDHIDSNFLYYLLKEERNNYQFKKIEMVAVQPSVKISQMIHLKFYVPEKTEQQKIASFLTAIDDKIIALNKKVTALKQYKKGIMQKIFSQQIRFRDENGDLYPDWKKLKLNEIFNEICQKVGDSNIETYSITAGKGFISQSKKFGKDISGNQNKNYILLNEGDFSYNKGNSKTYKYGCVYVNNENKQIAVPNVFISFRLKIPNMSISYFEQLFISHYLDKYLIQIISSGARMDGLLNVSKGSFFSIKVLTPSNEEQQKIANFLTTIDQKITAEESKLKIAKKWKKGLLQRMFI